MSTGISYQEKNTASDEVSFPASVILGHSEPPVSIENDLKLRLTEHTYLPKHASPRSDWVYSVARPAFYAYKDLHCPTTPCNLRFCSIGTGSGTDALAAIEILTPREIVVTDLHADVINNAIENIKKNIRNSDNFNIKGLHGDLGNPLIEAGMKFDLIYENLPNIPALDDIDIYQGINSSSFSKPRTTGLPSVIEENLLDLHYLFLGQAADLLNENGHIFSSIGARMPLEKLLDLQKLRGFTPSILTYTWKIQSEPEDVVGSYARWQRERSCGPFHFYRVEDLQRVFNNVSPRSAALNALEIQETLRPHEIDAETALSLVHKGVPLGHTVVVLDSAIKA